MKTKRMLKLMGVGLLVLALTAGLLLGGCGITHKEPVLENGVQPEDDKPEPDETEREVTYTVVDNTSLPQSIQADLELLQKQRGYFVFAPPAYATEEAVYMMVSAGEKPTGGFFLKLVSVEDHDGMLKIKVEEKEPAENEMVIQVLTYPTLMVRFEQAYESYKVTDTEERLFPELTEADIPQLNEVEGIFNGQIDSNFIEISVDGAPGAYMLPRDLSWVLAELLNSGDEVVFTYIVNEHGQYIIRELDTKERAGMTRDVRGIFVGLIDSNSVEIEVEGKARAYALVEQLVITDLNEGDSVVFDYYEDRHGRQIISRMEKE